MLILFTQYLKGYGGFYMSRLIIPKGYSSNLTAYETQTAIGLIKRSFEINLCQALNLKRASAPLFVDDSRGLNDNLNGYERPVSFEIKKREAEPRWFTRLQNGSASRSRSTASMSARVYTPI